ncbi:radical SAM protein [Chloroflexota bacterium]
MSFKRPEIIRPPSEWKSYYLPLTSDCSNSTYIFCNYYDNELRIREVQDVKKEIDALFLYMTHGVRVPDVPDIVYIIASAWDGTMVFLQDSDALVYPFPELAEVLQYLNEKFPYLERVAAYATAQDILRRTPEELRRLSSLKLGILYMGVESGDGEVLQRVNKGVGYHQMVEAGKKAREAGITLSVTVILGLGGVEGSQRHSLATTKILTDIDPDYVGALTLRLVPGTPLYKQAQQGDFLPISPFQSLEELKVIIDNSSFTNCFFSSMHASNYFAIRGSLPDEKERMLGELEYILARDDRSLLRPEFLRGL